MKHTIIFAALAASALLAGCQKNEIVSEGGSAGRDINFTSYVGRPVTKAASDLNQSFAAEAYLTTGGTQYFPSTVYTYASSSYTGATSRYWPVSGNLDFYAVSPLTYKNTSSASADLTLSSKSFAVTATDGSADIVGASLTNVTNGTPTVALVFGHKLTKIAFKAIGADQTKKYVITDLILAANSTSTFTFGSPDSWAASSTSYNYDYVSSDVTIAASTSTAQAVGSAKYLIPNQASSLTATVKYAVYDGDNLIDDNTSIGVNVSLPTTSWGINKSVVYKLTLNLSSSVKPIAFSATLEDWDADSESAISVTPGA